MANSVFVSGNDVYMAGIYSPGSGYLEEACVWKNGEILFSFGASPGISILYSVFVSGSDVYAAGRIKHTSQGLAAATVWKNGEELHRLLAADAYNNGSSASSVYVLGNDVYAAGVGYEYTAGINVARLWKNGEEQPLVDETSDSQANSIFVK
jgi:hypothetical protein